jgi:hypothetical protein
MKRENIFLAVAVILTILACVFWIVPNLMEAQTRQREHLDRCREYLGAEKYNELVWQCHSGNDDNRRYACELDMLDVWCRDMP